MDLNILILYFPLISAISLICFGHILKKIGALIVSSFYISLSTILCIVLMYDVILKGQIIMIYLFD